MTTPTGVTPSIGEDGVVSEGRPLQLHTLPTEVGIRRQPVSYTCLDASQQFLVVGSAQGYVWIVELYSFRLLREYSEFKGNSITVVKLNPHRDYVAYGTSHGFIKVERISKVVSNKCRVQEKNNLPATTLEWGPNGDDIFCGFSSGRLVRFSVRFTERTMNHVPLFPEQYGSNIVQLSVYKTSLLVSTLERTFVLDTETNKLSQVGRKERKVGPYGGCYLHSDGSVLVSRPGVRIWLADGEGNVQGTMTFKDTLTSDHLPLISVSSVPASAPKYSRSWQFATLHPWLEGRFIVTFHQETIFVLDVFNGSLVGACTFQEPVRSIAVSGGVLYVLLASSTAGKSIVRVSVHHSFMPVEMTLRKPLPISTSNSSTPIGSMENLLSSVGQEKEEEDREKSTEKNEKFAAGVSVGRPLQLPLKAPPSPKSKSEKLTSSSEDLDLSNRLNQIDRDSSTGDPEPFPAGRGTVGVLVASSAVAGSSGTDEVKVETPSIIVTTSNSPEPKLLSEEGKIDNGVLLLERGSYYKCEKPKDDGRKEDNSESERTAEEEARETKEHSQISDDEPSLEVNPNSLADLDVDASARSDVAESFKASLSENEKLRWQRMAEAGFDNGEDVVADKPKKKKKRTKGKKLSSAASSRSVSAERLLDVREELLGGGSKEQVGGEVGNMLSLPDQEQQQTCSEDPSSGDSAQSNNQDCLAEEIPAVVEVDSRPSPGSEPVVDNNSGQMFSAAVMAGVQVETETLKGNDGEVDGEVDGEEKELMSLESRTTIVAEEICKVDDLDSPTTVREELGDSDAMMEGEVTKEHLTEEGASSVEDIIEKRTNMKEEDTAQLSKEDSGDLEEEKLKARDCEMKEEPEVVVSTGSDHDTRLTSGRFTISQLEDTTDNPLYQDTDEEFTSDISEERSTASTDYSREEERLQTPGASNPMVKHHPSLLNPVMSDPFQDEENLQTGTTATRKPRWLPTSSSSSATRVTATAVLKRPNSHNQRHLLATDRQTIAKSWVEVNKKEAFYGSPKDQQPLFEASDSSNESDQDKNEEENSIAAATKVDMNESTVVEDFYQLCGDLMDKNAAPMSLQAPAQSLSPLDDSGPSSLPARLLCELDEPEVLPSHLNRAMDEETWDSWFNIKTPGLSSMRCVCLSSQLLWIVTNRGKVYHTRTNSYGSNWEHVKKTMQQIATSPSGRIVWGTYHQNAYVRLGIGLNPAGTTWKNITKTTSLSHKIKYLAVDESGVWAITVDGYVLFRREVNETCPEGKVWKEIGDGKTTFVSLSCCNMIVWALSGNGKVFFRDGITSSSPSGTKWCELRTTKMAAISLMHDGTAWGITEEGAVGFRTGVSHQKPGGRGPWWEVTVERQERHAHASSPINSLLQVISSDGHGISVASVASLVSLPLHQQNIIISASAKGGVVILEAGNKLYWCKNVITGYHYTSACKDDIFRFDAWSRVAVGRTATWFVRCDGSLHCLSPEGVLKQIEVPATVELIAASYNCLWVISKDMVWSRQGMSSEIPEGLSFDYIELSTLLHSTKLQSVACGKKVAWAVDTSGIPHFRFGVHAREPGTGMSPAWVPVEEELAPLLNVTVCGEGWLVWACDRNHDVYAREGVTVDFPVGRKWRAIPKLKMKELAATSDRVYGLTPVGDLYCRQGISEKNVAGNYWRKLPGTYEHIATGNFGELYTLDVRGQVWRQEWRVLKMSSDSLEDLPDSEAWEVIN